MRSVVFLSLVGAVLSSPGAMPSEVFASVCAGSLAGMASTLVCHPMDTVRTRMQTSTVGEYASTRDCIQKILAREGWRALYRGLAGPFMAQAVYKSIIFTTNSSMRKLLLARKRGRQQSGLSSLDSAVCGAVSGALNAAVVTPVELVRNNLMTDVKKRFNGPITVVRYVVKNHGFQGLWKGLSATILRDGLGMASYFLFYFESKKLLTTLIGSGGSPVIPAFWQAVLAAGLAGTGYWLVALPLDTIKSLVQESQFRAEGSPAKRGAAGRFFEELRRLLKFKGVAGLFAGWPVAFGRGIPGAIVTLTVYDSVLRTLST